ncbi:MAG TPA: enoyl-CoA hydratase/isomerase family protein [Pseudonocardiaceae bacterium]
MTTSLVRYEVGAAGVARIVLDDPRTRNALTDALLDELIECLQRARDDDEVRVVVLTSADDRVFSSGGDLKAFASDRPVIDKYSGLDRFPRLYRLLGGLGKPSVCAANGDVLAGAFGLALACDLIVARDGVRFGCPEINVGVFPFMISALIYRSVPRAKANELMMTGELISAKEALDLHVVNRVVADDEFDGEVDRWARRIASRSPLLMRLGKDALDVTRDMALSEALNHLRGQLALAFTTEDIQEGVAAFREKRDPQWRRR